MANKPGEAEHSPQCAERIRLRALVRAGEPDPAPVHLLHEIAAEIARCCGYSALKSHRLAWAWTVEQAVREFHRMCAESNLGARGLVARSWLGWEAGANANDDHRDLLCRLFQTSGVALGFASDYTPPRPAAEAAGASAVVVEARPRLPAVRPPQEPVAGLSMSFAGSAADALEFTRRAEASDLGPQTLDHLASVIDAIAAAFPYTAPADLFPQVKWYRHQVAAFIEGRQTLRECRELFRDAGWLSIILGWLSHDLGDALTAEAHCLDAWGHGWQAESGEICAWSMDTLATVAMYNSQPAKAHDAALKGLAQVAAGTPAGVRLSCQLTRASGRLGDREEFNAALRTTRRSLERLAEQGSGLFSADAGRISSYAATSSIWLGHPLDAVGHAREALRFYADASPADRSPTREAITRLDLALGLLQLDAPDGAVEQAMQALDTDRLTGTVLTRAGELNAALGTNFATSPVARGFRECFENLLEARYRPQLTSS